MKISLTFLLIAISLCTAYAQSTTDSAATRNNSLKINPLSLIVGDVSVFYERMLTKRASLVGGVGFGSETYEYHNANNPVPRLFHYKRATLEYRHYFRRRPLSPTGLYAGVYGRYSKLRLDDYQFDNQGTIIRDQSGGLVRATQQLYVWMPGALAGVQTSIGRGRVRFVFGISLSTTEQQSPSEGSPAGTDEPERFYSPLWLDHGLSVLIMRSSKADT